MKIFTISTVLFFLIAGNAKSAINADSTIVVNGVTRSLLYSLPDDYNPDNSYPLVIGIHYCGGTAAEYRTALAKVTNDLDMIVACPDYNTFLVPNTDTNLFRIIVDSAKSAFNISMDDIYLTGMSCNAEFILRQALNNIYPFKGIFPWDPYGANPSAYNLDCKIPIVLAFGTIDPGLYTDIALYDSLSNHNANITVSMVPGIGHQLAFSSFGSEMVKCLLYLNDTNAITISQVEDKVMFNNETLEVDINIAHGLDKDFTVKAISSRLTVLPNPVITHVDGTDIYKLKFTPIATKTGTMLIQVEADEVDGRAIEQTIFKIKVEQAVVSAINETSQEMLVKVYPNPATDQLFVEWNADKANIQISDLAGKEYLSGNYENQLVTIPLSGLSTGLYFIKITTISGVEVQKFLVK